jgi:hypothetical protein
MKGCGAVRIAESHPFPLPLFCFLLVDSSLSTYLGFQISIMKKFEHASNWFQFYGVRFFSCLQIKSYQIFVKSSFERIIRVSVLFKN